MLGLAGLLGAAVVVLPSVASSETTPTIEAVTGVYGENRWKPPTATVNAGGEVTFTSPSTEVSHGVEWRPGNPSTPTCTAGVPVGSTLAASGKHWTGTCKFSQPGKYTFWCTVHGSEMSGTITVNAKSETIPNPPPTGTSPAPVGGGGGGQPGSTTPQYGSAPASLLAGSASNAVKLASSQHGQAVRGSVDVSQAGGGGRLEVDLFAKKASLASAGGAKVAAGRLVLSSVHAGKVSFSVPLNGRARAALHRHHRLALTVRITLRGPGASPVTVVRSLVLRP